MDEEKKNLTVVTLKNTELSAMYDRTKSEFNLEYGAFRGLVALFWPLQI